MNIKDICTDDLINELCTRDLTCSQQDALSDYLPPTEQPEDEPCECDDLNELLEGFDSDSMINRMKLSEFISGYDSKSLDEIQNFFR